MAQKTEKPTSYYDLEGAAVIWRDGEFPRFVATGAVINDFERLAQEGTPISKAHFDRLVALDEKDRAT
jgi:hypothetical protein